MCPICILSAIVLGTSAASAGGLNWLRAKLGGKQDGFGTECSLFPAEEAGRTVEREASTHERVKGAALSCQL